MHHKVKSVTTDHAFGKKILHRGGGLASRIKNLPNSVGDTDNHFIIQFGHFFFDSLRPGTRTRFLGIIRART